MKRIAWLLAVCLFFSVAVYAAEPSAPGGKQPSDRAQTTKGQAKDREKQMDMETWRNMTPDQRVMEVVNAMYEKYDLNNDGLLDKKEAFAMMKERAEALAQQQKRVIQENQHNPMLKKYPPMPWYE